MNTSTDNNTNTNTNQYLSKYHTYSDKTIKICCAKLIEGRAVIFPTDTIYNIGVSAFNPDALELIRQINNHPVEEPLTLYVLSWEMANVFCSTNEIEKNIISKLTSAFWPGPLTISVRKNNTPSNIISGSSEYIQFRYPKNIVCKDLLTSFTLPLAVIPIYFNKSIIPITDSIHLREHYNNHGVDIVLQDNPCSIGIESTINRRSSWRMAFGDWQSF